MSETNFGIVTSGSVGWKTVRKRWEEDLADLRPTIHHIEDHARALAGVTERYGAKSVGHAVAGRLAASAALAAGAKVVLLTTLQNSPLLPLREDVTYLVYGDCTTSQLAELYGGKKVGLPGALLSRRLRRLAAHGCTFLCMSKWYADALRDEFGVAEDRVVALPFYVDTDKWRPLASKPATGRPQALFVGGDLARKGGDIVYALARAERFRNVDFHIVSPDATPAPDNVHAYRNFSADSPDLARLAAQCDIFLLPTRADTSSNAAMEAAACGLPAIITRRGGTGEIVLDGVTGAVLPEPTLASFAERLSAYLADPELLARHGRNAREHVERNFSRTAHMKILRSAIDDAFAMLRRRSGATTDIDGASAHLMG
ncbi:glycosyltransferase family 4 protein [Methylosinus sp. Ce-a6]|uniref:glycosyltransferase family 4 protein n=1 Tax=Methylosinus sp. Ce-a6 TaxID=2172005 RepID=UPI00135960CC|nr:glycosyltransferase family 4 protein [Methylosinus sp. Ce-a6]